MKIEKLPLDDIIKYYMGKDPGRTYGYKINKKGDFAYATDGHVLIKCPAALVSNHEHVENFPDCDGAISSNTSLLEIPLVINVAKMLEFLEAIPKTDVYEECHYCSGNGVIECNLGHEHECEACDSKGNSNKKIGEELSDKTPIEIGNSYYNPKYILLVCKTALSLNLESFAITNQAPNTAMVASLNDSTVVIMSLMKIRIDGLEYDKVYKYTGI